MIHHFYKRLSEYLLIYLLLLVVFFLFRVLFLFSYGNITEILQSYKVDLMKCLWVGFRCDTVVLCFSLFPLFALNLLGFLFFFSQSFTQKFHHFLQVFSKIYTLLLFVVLFLVNVIDFYYYQNFQSHFDNRFFGITEDGTKEVMASVWSDYPIIILILIFIVVLFFWVRIVKRVYAQKKPWLHFHGIWALIATLLLSSGLLFLGARSSVTTFPFGKNDLAFSVNLRLNDVAANGVFMLKEAISEKMSNTIHLNEATLLSSHGYNSIEEAKRDWDSNTLDDNHSFFAHKSTPKNPFLESHPPNIILIIMEGWSSHFFNFHSSQFNLLGALEEELPYLIHFPMCFPVNYGTISALETFFTNNIGPPLSLSQYANIPLSTSSAFSFHQLNYETSYYTGGYVGWRNVGKYARTQGFENVRGAEFAKSLFPNAEKADWGVFDQYMFDALSQKLQEKNVSPQFIICMTITNHSPHKIPKNYTPLPLEIPDSFKTRITGDLQQILKGMETFQYANDCLGKFIHNLKDSPMGDNTIVVVTGDHTMTGGFTYNVDELLYNWAVPLMFYIPEKYKQPSPVNTKRLVSHKDILPTIFHLALSDYNYSDTGDNIFDASTEESAFVVTQVGWALGKAGVIHLQSGQSFSWLGDGYLIQAQESTPELEAIRKRANAWMAGMKWKIFSDIKGENF